MHLNRRAFFKLGGSAFAAALLAACAPEEVMNPGTPVRQGISGAATALPTAGIAALLPTLIAPQPADLTRRFQQITPTFAPAGLLAAWAFNEGSGYQCHDLSGHGHTAYLTGSTWNTSDSGLTARLHGRGQRGGAILLNGRQWLQVQQTPDLQLQGQFSLTAWVRLDQPGAYTLLAKGNEYTLAVDADGTLRWAVGDQLVTSPPAVLRPALWGHIAATADAARGQLRLYVDGKLVASADQAAFSVPASTADLCLGGVAGGQGALSGGLSELTLHRLVLSAAEVSRWWALGIPTIYRQTRETINSAKTVWTAWKGNTPIPHPLDPDTLFSVRYNGAFTSDQGHTPQAGQAAIVAGAFGGALDTRQGGLRYASPIVGTQGTFAAWVLAEPTSSAARQSLFRAEARDGWLELALVGGQWQLATGTASGTDATAQGPAWQASAERLLHVAAAWGPIDGRPALLLVLNGVVVARADLPDASLRRYDQAIMLGGSAAEAFQGAIDDASIVGTPHGWGTAYPRGHVATEAASLDLRDYLDHAPGEPLHLWRGLAGAPWRYTGQALQSPEAGFQPLFHPDAYGHMSSIEAGVTFTTLADGWAGVFVQAAAPDSPFAGYSFALNPQRGMQRLAAHQAGTIVAEKLLPYDFAFATGACYTLTLTAADDGILRGYIDGNSSIAFSQNGLPAFRDGYAGLVSDRLAANFSDIHFTALTPATSESRLIEQRLFVDGQSIADAGGYSALNLSALRWHKWPAQLPWRRGGPSPEPPGALFGPADAVPRANPAAAWRSEDSANSDVISVNGMIYYFMRGNPRVGNRHGPAAIGVHLVSAAQFDGRHFNDQNGAVSDPLAAQLLRGNRDNAPDAMRDQGLRRERFQANDQGSAYIGDGRVLVFAREFRNRVGTNPWYRRLGYGIYNLVTNAWQQPELSYVEWSKMAADNPAARLQGLDATPELVALRDPASDAYTVFLLHHQAGTRIGAVSGLALADGAITLDPRYPQRDSFVEEQGNVAYGERVLFDNGIYYLHYNAATTASKMAQDWPDRLHLAASLHPYQQPFINSADNLNDERPYFGRGEPGDFDNGAIWQGCMFKHQGRYYLYYEAYHAINSVDTPYEAYDDISAGSRAGYATAAS